MRDTQLKYRRGGVAMQRLLIILAAVLLVISPVLLVELPREAARWYRARAEEAALNTDYATAVTELDKAIAWNEGDAELFLRRADFKLKTGQWESGLDDCDRARQLMPDHPEIGAVRSQLLTHLGRHEGAIAELKETLYLKADANPGDRAELLNALAYACAVGGRELEDGLESVEESLGIVITRAGVLDPRGYLCFHRAFSAISRGENQVARESLDEAVRHAETSYQRSLNRLRALRYLPRGQDEYAQRVLVLKAHLAGILKLRALLFDDLEQPQRAAADRQRLDELAHGGNLAISEPMEFMAAVAQLQSSGNMLDTRGFLHYRLGDLAAARRDLQRAVDIIDLLCSTFPWQIEAVRHDVVDIRRLTLAQDSMLQAKAVMYYHQMLVHQALGMDEKAAEDRAQVIDLGYEPDEQLF